MDRDILPLLVVATAVLAALLAAAALLAPVDARAPDAGGAAGGPTTVPSTHPASLPLPPAYSTTVLRRLDERRAGRPSPGIDRQHPCTAEVPDLGVQTTTPWTVRPPLR